MWDSVWVVAKKDANQQKQLVAYVVPQSTFDPDAIKTHLKAVLPDFMIPSIIVELGEMPLTNNGKVDRRALPDLDISALQNRTYVAPGTDMEKNLSINLAAITWRRTNRYLR